MIKPLGNKIVVSRIAAAKQTQSGIILKTTEEPDKAKVEAVGPDVDEVQLDDVVLINWNKAVKADDELYVLPITEVIFVFE